MNVEDGGADAISPAHWETPAMRQALARHDLKTVYALLGRVGVTQRRISRLTGQSASEVYQIMSRGRRVQAHEVLVRIADGLGVPRGYMGLAYDEETTGLLDLPASSSLSVADERDEVLALLSDAANATIAFSAEDALGLWKPVDSAMAPAPSRIGMSDVAHVEALTDAMRVVDDKHGGGACRDAIAAQVRWTQQLLTSDMSGNVRTRLAVALADLHMVAGWTSFDLGMHSVARAYFGRALRLSRAGDDWALSASVLYTMARLHLHIEMAREGLRLLQLGQIAAQNSGSAIMTSLICVNQAWAYGMLDDRAQMASALRRAESELLSGDQIEPPRRARFYGQGELHAMAGTAQMSLPSADSRLLAEARTNLERSFVERGDAHPRSSALALPLLAITALRLGDTASAVESGTQALEAARQINSVRIIDRLTPLADALTDSSDSDARDLRTQIRSLRAAT